MKPLYRCLFTLSFLLTAHAQGVEFSAEQDAVIRSFGPWPSTFEPDSSNRFSGNPQAVELGRQLFFDRRLSAGGVLSCADCHQPHAQFADTVALNRGLKPLKRHTTSLVNLRARHWFGWGGENDTLWAQSLRPILAADEMGLTADQLKKAFTLDERFQCQVTQLTGQTLDSLDEQDFTVFVGKVLASFQETIVTRPSKFDRFLESWTQDNSTSLLTDSERRGLAIFSGEGRCFFCHSGPNFSNGEFANIGVSFFTADGADKGRYGGIQQLRHSEFNLLSRHNDGDANLNAIRTQRVELLPRNWGEFRVPSLRNVAETAPYMHNGSLTTLDDVIEFYSNLNEERLHADGEKILRPLNFTQLEKADLKSFLVSLTAPITYATEQPTAFDCD